MSLGEAARAVKFPPRQRLASGSLRISSGESQQRDRENSMQDTMGTDSLTIAFTLDRTPAKED